MSDGAISQDEIDALLSGVDLGGMGSAAQSSSSMRKVDTKPLEEFSAGTVESLQSNLNTMTGAEFAVSAPNVEIVTRDDLLKRLPEMIVGITADFTEGMTGDHLFLLSPEFAKKLAGLINKEEITELDDMSLSVISEIVSQHSGAEITALSQTGKFPGLACAPAEAMHVAKAMVRYPQQEFVLFSYAVKHESEEFTLWEAISNSVAFTVSNALNPAHDAAVTAAPQQNMQPQMNMGMGGGAVMDAGAGMQMPMGDMNPMMGGMNPMMGGMSMGQMPGGMPNVQPLQYPNLQNGISSMEQGNISLIMDVFMEMTVELGRTKKQIKEILGMGEGTIIELDKLAGEPVDILVNHKPIAKGEVVVIDENFGVRVTEILSPIERVSGIK